MIPDVSVDAHAWVSAMEISMEAFFFFKKKLDIDFPFDPAT